MNQIKKSYAIIAAIFSNIQDGNNISQTIGQDYNNAIDELGVSIGENLNDFKIPNELFGKTIHHYETPNYITGENITKSSEQIKLIDWFLFKTKAQSVLTYFTIRNEDIKIGFNLK